MNIVFQSVVLEMKELRQAQAQAKVENLARSSKLVEAQARNENLARSSEKIVEAQDLARRSSKCEKLVEAENLAQSLGQAQAKVEKWPIWKVSDLTKFAIKKLHWSLQSDDVFGKVDT